MKQFSQFYVSKEFCDVEITFGDNKMFAHSLILAAYSTEFLHSLKSEKKIDFTHDSDCSLDVVQGFLDFIYGLKTVKELENIILELLKFAHKYKVESLQYECEIYLSDSINLNNAVKYLLLACKYECNILKDLAATAVSANIKEIIDSKEFDELLDYKNGVVDLITGLSSYSTKTIIQNNYQRG